MIERFNGHTYSINNTIMMKVKSLKNCRAKAYKFEAVTGEYSIQLSSAEPSSFSLYIPSFVSQMFSAKPLIENDDLEFVETTFDTNIIGNDLGHRSYNLRLYDNGFILTNPAIKIHPSYFRSRIVGLAFF